MSANEYDETSFWAKIKNTALKAGRKVIEIALRLYYAAQRSDTPIWAKTVIYGALAYFISPIDVIPDITHVIGYTDDFGVMTTAVATVSAYINEDVKNKAAQKLTDWFG